MYIIKLVGLASGQANPLDGQFLVRCDVDANNGRGEVKATRSRKYARLFSTVREAHEYWIRQSERVPLRPDGRANRPLTAFTVEIQPYGGG